MLLSETFNDVLGTWIRRIVPVYRFQGGDYILYLVALVQMGKSYIFWLRGAGDILNQRFMRSTGFE